MLTISNGLIFCGIFITLIGSMISTFSLLFEKKDTLVSRFLLVPDCNIDALRAQVEHNKKSEIGVIYIILGSVSQISSFLFTDIGTDQLFIPAWLCILIPSIFILYYFIFFKRNILRTQIQVEKIANDKLHNG